MKQSTQNNKEKTENTQVVFMPKLYDETMQLLVQSKNYFSLYHQEDQRLMSPLQKLIYSAVMSRITLRLSTIMSWLMARRAYHAGQITMEEMETQYRLLFQQECMKESTHFSYFLPSFVQKLCRDTLALYSRIHVLDRLVQQKAA